MNILQAFGVFITEHGAHEGFRFEIFELGPDERTTTVEMACCGRVLSRLIPHGSPYLGQIIVNWMGWKERDEQPELLPDELLIWRYMDYWKFEWMLEHSALYFVRIDRLPDAFEGAIPTRSPWLVRDPETTERRSVFRWFRDWTFVNCWAVGDRESELRWKRYTNASTRGPSVVLLSSYGRLRRCLPWWAHIGKVRYIDYQRDMFSAISDVGSDLAKPFLHKRKEFEDDQELRAVSMMEQPDGEHQECPIDHEEYPVDLNRLIDKIIVAPGSSADGLERVRAFVEAKNLDIGISSSALDATPLY